MNERKKVVLPKEVAGAIERLREIGISDYAIINEVGRRQPLGSTGLTPHLKVIEKWVDRTGRGDELLGALVNGYEKETTPDELLRAYYECFPGKERIEAKRAIEVTLNILGITVEGIND